MDVFLSQEAYMGVFRQTSAVRPADHPSRRMGDSYRVGRFPANEQAFPEMPFALRRYAATEGLAVRNYP